MLPTIDDTSDEARRVQIALLRAAGPDKRLQLMRRMTNDAIERSRAAIAERHPEWDELEVKLQWAEIHYGKPIADAVRRDLAERNAL